MRTRGLFLKKACFIGGFRKSTTYYQIDNLQNKQIMEEIYQNTILDLNE